MTKQKNYPTQNAEKCHQFRGYGLNPFFHKETKF